MVSQEVRLRVVLAEGSALPSAVVLGARCWRVTRIQRVLTRGLERRYVVETRDGVFELGCGLADGVWSLRRQPGLFARAWRRFLQMPRYPLPAHQRRGRPARQVQPAPVLRLQWAQQARL